MQTKSPPRMQVVKCDDKKEKLIAFIEEHLDRRASAGDYAGQDEIQVVALSVFSPVVEALKAVTGRPELQNVKIKLIVADTSADSLLQQLSSFKAISARWAKNIRLLDAHEQLVLSSSCSWTGDCMRREPAKRDAYECFADDCLDTGRWARISFERLWAISLPLMGENDPSQSDGSHSDAVVPNVENASSERVVGTLH